MHCTIQYKYTLIPIKPSIATPISTPLPSSSLLSSTPINTPPALYPYTIPIPILRPQSNTRHPAAVSSKSPFLPHPPLSFPIHYHLHPSEAAQHTHQQARHHPTAPPSPSSPSNRNPRSTPRIPRSSGARHRSSTHRIMHAAHPSQLFPLPLSVTLHMITTAQPHQLTTTTTTPASLPP